MQCLTCKYALKLIITNGYYGIESKRVISCTLFQNKPFEYATDECVFYEKE